MGLLTAIRKFRYPVSTDPFNPPLDLKNLADDVDAWTGNQVIPKVADNTERDQKYPNPAQGQMCFRNDLGYDERYFEAWSAGGNPGGALVAGWYPIGGGRLPFYRCWPSGNQPVGPNSQSRLVDGFWGPAAANHARKGFGLMANGIIAIPLSGWYDLDYQIGSPTTGAYVEINIVRGGDQLYTDNTNNLGRHGTSGTTAQIKRRVLLAAGDQLRFWFFHQAGGVIAPRANAIDSWANVEYVCPPTPSA